MIASSLWEKKPVSMRPSLSNWPYRERIGSSRLACGVSGRTIVDFGTANRRAAGPRACSRSAQQAAGLHTGDCVSRSRIHRRRRSADHTCGGKAATGGVARGGNGAAGRNPGDRRRRQPEFGRCRQPYHPRAGRGSPRRSRSSGALAFGCSDIVPAYCRTNGCARKRGPTPTSAGANGSLSPKRTRAGGFSFRCRPASSSSRPPRKRISRCDWPLRPMASGFGLGELHGGRRQTERVRQCDDPDTSTICRSKDA